MAAIDKYAAQWSGAKLEAIIDAAIASAHLCGECRGHGGYKGWTCGECAGTGKGETALYKDLVAAQLAAHGKTGEEAELLNAYRELIAC